MIQYATCSFYNYLAHKNRTHFLHIHRILCCSSTFSYFGKLLRMINNFNSQLCLVHFAFLFFFWLFISCSLSLSFFRYSRSGASQNEFVMESDWIDKAIISLEMPFQAFMNSDDFHANVPCSNNKCIDVQYTHCTAAVVVLCVGVDVCVVFWARFYSLFT